MAALKAKIHDSFQISESFQRLIARRAVMKDSDNVATFYRLGDVALTVTLLMNVDYASFFTRCKGYTWGTTWERLSPQDFVWQILRRDFDDMGNEGQAGLIACCWDKDACVRIAICRLLGAAPRDTAAVVHLTALSQDGN